MPSPTILLAIALGLSMLANTWLFNSRDNALTEAATQRAANVQLAATGKACSDSVDKLATASATQGKRLERLITGESGRILTLQHQANDALSARPAFPADICKSVEAAMRAEIVKDRARRDEDRAARAAAAAPVSGPGLRLPAPKAAP